jgi:hypothetical protein
MVIDIVNVNSIPARKGENHPPVRANGNRPKAFQLSLKGMQPEPRQVHIRCQTGRIETRKNVTQLFRVLPDHASRVVLFVKTFQSFMADLANQFSP